MVKRASVIASIMKCFEEDYRLFLETEDLSGLMETYMSMLVNRIRTFLYLIQAEHIRQGHWGSIKTES